MAKKKKYPEMVYVGRGRFLPGIPKRDLTPKEVERFGLKKLEDSGLYEVKENE